MRRLTCPCLALEAVDGGGHTVTVVGAISHLAPERGCRDCSDPETVLIQRLHRQGGRNGQEHRHPLRRARDGVLGLHQLARHAGLGDVRDDGGIESGGDADEDERAEARGVRFRLQVETGESRGQVAGHGLTAGIGPHL